MGSEYKLVDADAIKEAWAGGPFGVLALAGLDFPFDALPPPDTSMDSFSAGVIAAAIEAAEQPDEFAAFVERVRAAREASKGEAGEEASGG